MGNLSEKLSRKLSKMAGKLPLKALKGHPGNALPGDVKDIPSLIKEGADPVFAIYANLQQMTSLFAEGVSRLPEMKQYYKLAGDAEDDYMPDGPPWSPLTRSYFTTWAFYDLRIGQGGDTIGTCLIETSGIFGMHPGQVDVLKKLQASRMGIYEHCGSVGGRISLRELITEAEFTCHCEAGYHGKPGELWFVRLCPPPVPKTADYHVAFTTPYVLLGASKRDWTDFLKRTMLQVGAKDDVEAMYGLMKWGLEPRYWPEFIFRAYHHSQKEAIFLTGIPDIQATLPHA